MIAIATVLLYVVLLYVSLFHYLHYLPNDDGRDHDHLLRGRRHLSTGRLRRDPAEAQQRDPRAPTPTKGRAATVAMLVVSDAATQQRYVANTRNLATYASSRHYDFDVVDVSSKCKDTVGNFFFQKHCTVLERMERRDAPEWFVVLDGDAAVVNSNRTFDDYMVPSKELLLGLRFHNNEFMAGFYIIRNTEWGRRFIHDWVSLNPKSLQPYPGGNHDNGALHWLLLHRLADAGAAGGRSCEGLGRQSSDGLQQYDRFVGCVHRTLARTRCRGYDWSKIGVYPRSKFIAMDVDRADNTWSEDSFMHHAMKPPYAKRSAPSNPSNPSNLLDRDSYWRDRDTHRSTLDQWWRAHRDERASVGWDEHSCVQDGTTVTSISLPLHPEHASR